MKNLTLIVILIVIILFAVMGYYFILSYSAHNNTNTKSPTIIPSPTQTQLTLCKKNQLAATISSEGAAGNIYATLTLTNTGKTTCIILLDNTITAMFTAKNIAIHYIENVSNDDFSLAPSAKVYSQVHYPNGPQCQSGIKQQPINFLYQTDQTAVMFEQNPQMGKVLVQACVSEAEKTTIDIWPLSKTPINP